MRVLVTGGSGFIGSAVISSLLERGDAVSILDRKDHGKKYSDKRIQIIYGDVTVPRFFDELRKDKKRFDAIIHLASITDTTFKDDAEMIRQNVAGFRNILEYAKSCNPVPKIVYASSASVYGNGPVPMREDQQLRPLNAYARSKVELDNITKQLLADNPRMHLVGLRFFNVFGPGEGHKESSASMIFQITKQLLGGKKPRLFYSGEQRRDHIYVKDISRAVILALEAKRSGIYNVATGKSTSFNELLGMINNELGTHEMPEYFDNPYESVYQNHTMGATQLAEKYLGFRAQHSLQDALKEYIAMIRKEHEQASQKG